MVLPDKKNNKPANVVSRSVLLIEDDEVDQIAFIRAVREMAIPYNYHIAGSCAEAVRLMDTKSFDLIISDINLGDGTVFDILDEIRKTRSPLIVTTGAGDQETAVKALKNGAIDYLVKDSSGSYLRMLPHSVERAILRDQEQRLLSTLMAAVEQTHTAIAITSKEQIITYSNPGLNNFTENSNKRILGSNLSSLFHDNNVYSEALTTAETGGVWNGEVAQKRPDGTTRWEVVSLSEIKNRDGGREGYLWIAEDISPQKNAEFALEKEKERLSITLRSIGDGVIAISGDARIIYMNPKARELSGFQLESNPNALISEVYTLLDPVTKEKLNGDLLKVDTSDTALKARYLLVSGPGKKEIFIEQHVSPLPLPDGSTGKVIVFHDITDTIRKEEEQRRLQQLESLGILAGGIAHDLNNILTIILSNLVLVRDLTPENSEVLERLKAAERAVGRAKSLSRKFLTFSPGGDPVKEPIQLGEFLKSAPGGYIQGGNVQIEYDIPLDLPMVEVDPGQLGVAIHQISRNAVESMPSSGKLKIKCEVDEVDNGKSRQVLIKLIDTGSGILPEILPRVFEPYFSTKEGMQGLGLTTAHSIITRHKGKIDVQSTPGKGTSVTLSLPLTQNASLSEKPIEMKEKTSNRVLVMDDESAILDILSIMLSKIGYKVDKALDGETALKQFKIAKEEKSPYGLVIMDLIIPGGLGGKETIKFLREMDSDVPVLVSSGYSNDPVMANYQDYGFSDSLPKPYALKQLKEKSLALAPL